MLLNLRAMARIIFLLFIAMFCAHEARAQSRNVLLIIADDFGVDVAEFYPTSAARLVTNPPAPPMPNLKRLAGRGIVFRDAWGNMECSPTRATIFTGRYGFRTGVGAYIRSGYPVLSAAEFGLPEAFKARPALGYQLANVGKWNLSFGLSDPNLHGWTYYAGPRPGAGNIGNYFRWTKVVNGVESSSTTYATTDQVNEAVGVIRGAKAQGKPYHKPPNELHSRDSLPASGATDRAYYEAMIEAMDTEIGRLLESVDLATTTVIFVGDNGTPGGVVAPPYSKSKGKSTIYEGGIRVPLLVAGAGVVSPGRVVAGLVNTVDLYPTVLELAGIDPPAVVPSGTRIDGVSLVPHIANTAGASPRSTTYSEKFHLGYADRYQRAIRNRTYKLIKRADGTREFYNLPNDRRETTNLLSRALTTAERTNLDDLERRLRNLLATR
jgi:arylsulfatase A-like enzyme